MQAAYDAALATGGVEMDPFQDPPEPDTEEGAAIARVAASIAELAARRAAQLAAPPPPPPSEELRQIVTDRVIDSVIAQRVTARVAAQFPDDHTIADRVRRAVDANGVAAQRAAASSAAAEPRSRKRTRHAGAAANI